LVFEIFVCFVVFSVDLCVLLMHGSFAAVNTAAFSDEITCGGECQTCHRDTAAVLTLTLRTLLTLTPLALITAIDSRPRLTAADGIVCQTGL